MMKHSSSIVSMSGLALAIAATLASADAKAATAYRTLYSNPAGVCQGALPASETAIRKRPLAIQNEGSLNSFVTCSFTSQGGPTLTDVVIYFNAAVGIAATINCTGVSGSQTGSNQFIGKSVTTPTTGGQASIRWPAQDFAGIPANFPSGFFSVSCSLPPGAAINQTYLYFFENVGA